jgi:hypothetical protein
MELETHIRMDWLTSEELNSVDPSWELGSESNESSPYPFILFIFLILSFSLRLAFRIILFASVFLTEAFYKFLSSHVRVTWSALIVLISWRNLTIFCEENKLENAS